MKSKIKRHSRSVLSVILAISMLVSCMMVGLIATDAAKVTDSVAASDDSTVGDSSNLYVVGNDFDNDWSFNNKTYSMSKKDEWWTITANLTQNSYFKFHDGSRYYAPTSTQQVSAEGTTVYGNGNDYNNSFKVNSTNGTYIIWYKPSSGALLLVSANLYLAGYLNGSNVTQKSGTQFQQDPNDVSLVYATLTCSTNDQYFAVYADNTSKYYNFTYQNTNDKEWSNVFTNNNNTMASSGEKIQASGVNGKKITVYFSTRDRKLMWTAESSSASYYLHYAENDNGMGSATVQQMTDNGDGTYSYTVSDWDEYIMNVNVDKNLSNTTNSTELTSITVTADTGLSVNQATPVTNSNYYRAQFSLSSKPQTLTFSYNSSTKVLTITGGLQKYAITAGGVSTGAEGGYKLKVSDGSTTINNYGGTATATANFVQNKTLTVTVTPDVNTQKVTEISGCSSVTDNGNGTYSGTFTVSAEATVTATLATKSSYKVTFSAGSNGSVSATANGAALSSGDNVYEGTKVTFNASPNDGYGFAGWTDDFTDKLSTVTKTITANTTVTATFAKQSYVIVEQGEYIDGYAMKELSNGAFITKTAAIANGHWFRIRNTANGLESQGNKKGQDLVANKKTAVTNWGNYSSWSNGDKAFNNKTGAAAYVVYDPATDTVYLTTERDGLFSSYDVYIKDGTVRNLNNSWGGFSSDYGTTTLESTGTTSGVTASTVKKTDNPNEDNYAGHVKKITLSAEQVRSGVDLHIKTTVNSTYQSSYYVTGFDVNGGLTQGLISQEFDSEGNQIAAGSYSDPAVGAKIHTNHYNDFTLKLNGEKFPDGIIEVTPIYFPICEKEDDFVRFYAYDFTEDVKNDWGGALAVYPYIENKYDPYGKYPGQLMVNIDGSYYADIPATYNDNGTELKIQGLTMNNYVWDALHYDLFYGYDQSGNNWQTYDYNEFAVINELLRQNHKEGEDIIFSFKYKATKTRAASNLGESTYYADSDTNDPSNSKDYRNGYKSIDENDSQYQWEDLTDFYGKRVDIFGERVDTLNNDKMAYNPIRIVSNGYDDNKVGYYATAWALYKPVNASGANAWKGTVDHYELFDVIGGQGRKDRDYESESFLINPEQTTYRRVRMKYNKAFHNAHLNEEGYPQSTLILDASLVPVQITYEYNVQADKSNINTGPSQQAYRSDGRWYYSDSTQLIKANTIVEVANSKAGPFVRDYFQENNYDYKSGENYIPTKNAGLNTGVKAYLTNSNSVRKNDVDYQNVSGNTQAYAISDGKSVNDYHFKAEEDPDGNYTFVGWYRLTESGAGVGYTLASEDLEFSTEAKTNDVYVARFVKVPSGTLNISHSLTTDSRGSATCSAKAEILASDETTVEDSTSYPYTEGTLKIGSKYIKSTSDKYIRITIKTELGANTLFDKFEEKITNTDLGDLIGGSGKLGITATVAIDTSSTDKTATITFPINKLFTTADGETTQTVKSLPFYSKTSLPDYKYEITYNFGTRKLIQNGKLSNNRLWGNQFYKYKGTFTNEEVDQYLDLSGTPTFKSAETANYLAEHSPYEKNFLENTVWEFNGQTISYDASTHTFSCSLTATQTTNTDINVTFKLPFDYTLDTTTPNNYTFSVTKAQETDNPVYKDYKTVDQHASVTMDFLDWFSLNGVKNKSQMSEQNQPVFLKVPDVLYNSATNATKKRTFKYWAFFKDGDDIDTAEPYQKCYSSALNQAVYQDTIFYPVYTEELDMSADEIRKVAEGKSATITFLGVTRDQWNYNGGNTANSIWGSKFADRIFTDFVLSFTYENKLIDSLGNNYKTGLIIQTLEPSGAIEDETPENLAAKYASDNGKDAAMTKIKNTASDISESGVGKYLISYNQQALDDRNAIEYYYGIANVSQSTNPNNDTYTSETTRRNFGYRAYSFIKKGTGNSAEVIISDPVYFTIYDVASIQNGSKQVASGS